MGLESSNTSEVILLLVNPAFQHTDGKKTVHAMCTKSVNTVPQLCISKCTNSVYKVDFFLQTKETPKLHTKYRKVFINYETKNLDILTVVLWQQSMQEKRKMVEIIKLFTTDEFPFPIE